MSEIRSGQLVSLEFWPNGSKVTTCRAWLHSRAVDILELDERRLANKDERQQILADLTDLPAETKAELADLLATAAIVVLDAQERARYAREAKDDTKPAKAKAEPQWDEEVDGRALMAELIGSLRKYLVFPSKWATWAVALWVILTHLNDASEFSPLLIITSATRGSGKSRVLETLELFVLRPWKNLSPTDAVLFRKIDVDHPTLLVDEADNTNWRERPALVAILNGGFARSGAVVPRCVGEDLEPKDFSVWAPKALATKGLRGIPDTTLSRAVIVHMKRRLRSERVARFRERVARKESASLRAKVVRWAADHFADLANAEPAMPETISDRAADAWSPLVAIGDALGADWGDRAREAAVNLSGSELDAQDVAERLLADIRAILEPTDADTGKALPKVERMHSADLVAALTKIEDAPWADWGRGKGLTPAQLATLLAPFGIGSRQFKIDGRNRNGYYLAQFADAFTRTLPSQGSTSLIGYTGQGLTSQNEGLPAGSGRVVETGPNSFNASTSREVDPQKDETSAVAQCGAANPVVRPCQHREPLKPWMDAGGGFVCSVCHPNPNAPGAAQ